MGAMSGIRLSLAQEFKLEHLAFKDVDNLQLSTKFNFVSLFIRLMISIYTISVMAINYATNPAIRQAYELTHWAQMFTILTFLLSFCMTAFARKEIPKAWIKTLYFFQITSTNIQTYVVLLYWTLIASTVPEVTFFSVHLHLILFLLALVDVLLDQVPLRLIHFVFSFCFLLLYLIYTLVLYWTNVEPAVYGAITDWRSNGAVKAVGLTAGTLVVTFIINTIFCGVFRLRARCLNRPEEPKGSDENTVEDDTKGNVRQ